LKAACVHGVNPDVAVWGDSFAMHLVPGLIRSNPNLVQLTKSVCGPFRGLAPISEKYNKSWAQGCAAENEKSFSYITSTNSIKYVILSSPFGQYFNDLPGQYYIDGRVVSKDTAVGEKYLIETINKLKEAGKVPILVSPPPRSGFNIGACLERQDRDLVNFRRDCLVDYNEYIKESLNNVPILSDQTSISINQALKFQDEAGFA